MNEEEDKSWKLAELAELAGVSPRTIRYYVQRGLLPAPQFRGKDTAYSQEHLIRLRAIRQLQDRYLPLDAIQLEIARLSPTALKALSEEVGQEGREPSGSVQPAWTAGESGPARAPDQLPDQAMAGPPASRGAFPASRWERWELLPGLELHVSEGAGADVRSLAEELRAYAERRNGQGGMR